MENNQNISVFHQKVVLPIVYGSFTRADVDVAYEYYRRSPVPDVSFYLLLLRRPRCLL